MNVGLSRFLKSERLPETYLSQVEEQWQPLAQDILAWRRQAGTSVVVGICGSQGSGKSTLAKLLGLLLAAHDGMRVAVLSLDDLYLPRADRARLAAEVHPLLMMRGVPGTHDVRLGLRTIGDLLDPCSKGAVAIPSFDKATDDRVLPTRWEEGGPADIVLFEGWFVGARPQPPGSLDVAINGLERDQDADGRWRRYVNDQLAGPYQQLFGLLDHLIFLNAPSFEVVRNWRGMQEAKLRAAASRSPVHRSAGRMMDDAALDHFLLYYERITKHLFATMPTYADVTFSLKDDQTVLGRSGGRG